MVDREANISALVYLRGRAPATGPDTDGVVLETCRDEGLQQVIWLSRLLVEAELPSCHKAIRREGIRLYRAPGTDDGAGTLTWPAGRALLTVRHEASGGAAPYNGGARGPLRRMFANASGIDGSPSRHAFDQAAQPGRAVRR